MRTLDDGAVANLDSGMGPLQRKSTFARYGLAVLILSVIVPGAALSFAAFANHRTADSAQAEIRQALAPAAAPEPIREVLTWRSVQARHGGFDVDAPRWRPLGLNNRVLRRSDGLSRELFQFGEAGSARRHALIAVDRGDIQPSGAAADIAALATDLGIDARVASNHQALDTKFGAIASVDMAIDGPEGPKACLGFALRADDAHLRVSGWVCNAGPEIVSRADTACFVDRLVTIGAGDPAVANVFAKAELRRALCPQNQPTVDLGPMTLRTRKL